MSDTRNLGKSLLLAFLIAIGPAAHAVVINVPPGSASGVSAAVAKAKPGDVIQLESGIYSGTVEVSNAGQPERPITIAGPASGDRAVIDGGGTPSKGEVHQAFRINKADWIVIRNVDATNCWTNIIEIRDSSYVSVESCRFQDCGMTAVTAQGGSHHILMEGCEWSQNEKVFTTWDWAALHHGDLSYYNGGLYGGSGDGGGSVIRSNRVHNVFNGLRWWPESERAEGRKCESNIEIYDNVFWNCRDNVLEPERFTYNLHIYHNRLDSCPRGVLSIDGVKGGKVFFYGNTGLWKRNGALESTPWTVFKFANYGKKDSLDEPLYILHNSWAYNKAFVRGSKARKANDLILHYNNAYVHLEENGNLGLVDWPGQKCEFDYDISSRPWPSDVARLGLEKHGIAETDPKFRNALDNDFRLQDDSAAIDHGRIIDGFTLWYRGEAPDMGAYEGGEPIYGMPFVHSDPPGGSSYKERPRIVRIFRRGKELVVFFSTALDAENLGTLEIREDGRPVKIEAVSVPDPLTPQAICIDLRQELAEGGEIGLKMVKPPMGRNGQPATMWAADTRVVEIPEDATLVGAMRKLFKRPQGGN